MPEQINLQITRFFQNYGEPVSPQKSSQAAFDSQLKNILPLIVHFLTYSPKGTILDLGAGNGIILKRLSENMDFLSREFWLYLAVDFEVFRAIVLHLAVDSQIHRRVDFIPLEKFYGERTCLSQFPKPRIVIVRNVFHEISIQETAQLIFTLTCLLDSNDKIILQDLQVFPEAERGKVCWLPIALKNVLEFVGFQVTLVEEQSPSGNRWFTISGNLSETKCSNYQTILQCITDHRKKQYDLWSEALSFVLPQDQRPSPIAFADFDLQLAALQKQLIKIGVSNIPQFSREREAKVSNNAFSRVLAEFDLDSFLKASTQPLPLPVRCRDRGNEQTDIEEFLRSSSPLKIITGGPLMGKSLLVAYVLQWRSYNRRPIRIDCNITSTFWNLIEQFLSELTILPRYELISQLRFTSYSDVQSQFTNFFQNIAGHTIVIFDHFEKLLDPKGVMADKELSLFLSDLIQSESAKIIITSRKTPFLEKFPSEPKIEETMYIGRFPRDQEYIVNILDDNIDRPTLGIDQYPQELIDAIDRTPYLASFAGKIISQKGASFQKNPEFLESIKKHLRSELINQIVPVDCKLAIDLLSLLRGPTPKTFFQKITNEQIVESLINAGILYFHFDRQCGDLFRLHSLLLSSHFTEKGEEDLEDSILKTANQHKLLSSEFINLYRKDDDPRWLREANYHSLAAGDITFLKSFGSTYIAEIYQAAESWFLRKKDYPAALEAFRFAKSFNWHNYFCDLRIAACLIRTGQFEDGEKAYHALIKRFPKFQGPKTSHIDSLIFSRQFQYALEKITEYKLDINENAWVSQQYGRICFGLCKYREAIFAFERVIRREPQPAAYIWLIRALRRICDRHTLEKFITQARKQFPTNSLLKLSHAAHLIQIGSIESYSEAEKLLLELRKSKPDDPYTLQQLVKLLCLNNRVTEARKLLESLDINFRSPAYQKTMTLELLIAENKWSSALRELENTHSALDIEHLTSLRLKIYLHWANNTEEPEEQLTIAKRGLQTIIPEGFQNHVPILFSAYRLAKLAKNEEQSEQFLKRIAIQNSKMATEIEGNNYWNDPVQIDSDFLRWV